MFRLPLDKLESFYETIAADQRLYMSVDSDKGAVYKEWEKGMKLSNSLNTLRSAKDFFFPQFENLVEFKVEGKTVDIVESSDEMEDFILFGVRGCDAKSFEILDRVFLTEPKDSFYASKREHGTVVTLACTMPSETCFCKTYDLDLTEPGGDATCWITDEGLYIKPNTDKGEKLLEKVSFLLEEGDEKSVELQKQQTKDIYEKLPLASLTVDDFKGDVMLSKFDSKKWGDLSQACLACGTCTFVCPTCQCYDIKDFNTGHGVKRYRCWDSCMYSDFTKMSAGQPRHTQKERFRQRFMHKLVYYPMNNDGVFGCTGCGRCVEKCPVNMNIVKVAKSLGGNENE